MRQRAGMPKYKKKREAEPSLNYTQRGFRLKDGRLHLAGGIVLTVVWSRELPKPPSSVRVYRDSLGHWYASFVVPARHRAAAGDRPRDRRRLGREGDRDHHIRRPRPAPRRARQEGRAAKLTRYQRMMARRKPKKGRPASNGYREAKKQAAKLHKKVARQRQDTGRKWAKKVVRDHDALAVEDFRPKFLAKTTMARKAADAAIGATKQALIEMGRKHGRAVHLVHPAHTTMDCAHVRSESQARTASFRTNVYLHRVRSRVPQGQELRPRDARPGWSQPGWC